MTLQTITEVSKALDISTRMLRYYEQAGLIQTTRKEDYAYRMYDQENIKKLRQIILLRKLRVPMRQIAAILQSGDAMQAVDVFEQNIRGLDAEIGALSTIRDILSALALALRERADITLGLDVAGDEALLAMAASLSLPTNQIREERSMDDLIRAERTLSQLTDVRVIYLPPMTVAASHYEGPDSEGHAGGALDAFVRESGLLSIKPDVRSFGFNNSTKPSGIGVPSPGYEVWASIPDDMEVPPPLVKRRFLGGLYAAHAIKMGDFDHWLALREWVNDSEQYQSDADAIRVAPHMPGMDPGLEEHLNYYTDVQAPDFDSSAMQLDLLFPIRPVDGQPDETPRPIPGSEDSCGFSASLFARGKLSITGFTTLIPQDAGKNAIEDFFRSLAADGRLAMLLRAGKPGASLLGFASYDRECRKQGARMRYTVCLEDRDIADKKTLLSHRPFTKRLDPSKWVCYAVPRAQFFSGDRPDPHAVVKKLGFAFNGPISGLFDVFPEGNCDPSGDRPVYCWYPVQ